MAVTKQTSRVLNVNLLDNKNFVQLELRFLLSLQKRAQSNKKKKKKKELPNVLEFVELEYFTEYLSPPNTGTNLPIFKN